MAKKGMTEYQNFTGALKKVLQVSHDELKSRLEAEKQEKQQPRKRTSDRASSDKD